VTGPAAEDRHARLDALVAELRRAWAHTDALWCDLDDEALAWRPHEQWSPIAWHLGHQASVAHFMVRNLLAAEPSPDPALDEVFDSATPERERGAVPDAARLGEFRSRVADRVLARVDDVRAGRVGAPSQLVVVATTVVTALVNHEYQHDQWIGEVRSGELGLALPERPVSPLLTEIDGYFVVA
jgi:hypothetical protein